MVGFETYELIWQPPGVRTYLFVRVLVITVYPNAVLGDQEESEEEEDGDDDPRVAPDNHELQAEVEVKWKSNKTVSIMRRLQSKTQTAWRKLWKKSTDSFGMA